MKGGKRAGAGRKKGSRDKIRVVVAETVAERVQRCVEAGPTPLEYMLSVMRDENHDPSIRLNAANSAAPYVHRKQPQDVDVTARGLPQIVTIVVPSFALPASE